MHTTQHEFSQPQSEAEPTRCMLSNEPFDLIRVQDLLLLRKLLSCCVNCLWPDELFSFRSPSQFKIRLATDVRPFNRKAKWCVSIGVYQPRAVKHTNMKVYLTKPVITHLRLKRSTFPSSASRSPPPPVITVCKTTLSVCFLCRF